MPSRQPWLVKDQVSLFELFPMTATQQISPPSPSGSGEDEDELPNPAAGDCSVLSVAEHKKFMVIRTAKLLAIFEKKLAARYRRHLEDLGEPVDPQFDTTPQLPPHEPPPPVKQSRVEAGFEVAAKEIARLSALVKEKKRKVAALEEKKASLLEAGKALLGHPPPHHATSMQRRQVEAHKERNSHAIPHVPTAPSRTRAGDTSLTAQRSVADSEERGLHTSPPATASLHTSPLATTSLHPSPPATTSLHTSPASPSKASPCPDPMTPPLSRPVTVGNNSLPASVDDDYPGSVTTETGSPPLTASTAVKNTSRPVTSDNNSRPRTGTSYPVTAENKSPQLFPSITIGDTRPVTVDKTRPASEIRSPPITVDNSPPGTNSSRPVTAENNPSPLTARTTAGNTSSPVTAENNPSPLAACNNSPMECTRPAVPSPRTNSSRPATSENKPPPLTNHSNSPSTTIEATSRPVTASSDSRPATATTQLTPKVLGSLPTSADDMRPNPQPTASPPPAGPPAGPPASPPAGPCEAAVPPADVGTLDTPSVRSRGEGHEGKDTTPPATSCDDGNKVESPPPEDTPLATSHSPPSPPTLRGKTTSTFPLLTPAPPDPGDQASHSDPERALSQSDTATVPSRRTTGTRVPTPSSQQGADEATPATTSIPHTVVSFHPVTPANPPTPQSSMTPREPEPLSSRSSVVSSSTTRRRQSLMKAAEKATQQDKGKLLIKVGEEALQGPVLDDVDEPTSPTRPSTKTQRASGTGAGKGSRVHLNPRAKRTAPTRGKKRQKQLTEIQEIPNHLYAEIRKFEAEYRTVRQELIRRAMERMPTGTGSPAGKSSEDLADLGLQMDVHHEAEEESELKNPSGVATLKRQLADEEGTLQAQRREIADLLETTERQRHTLMDMQGTYNQLLEERKAILVQILEKQEQRDARRRARARRALRDYSLIQSRAVQCTMEQEIINAQDSRLETLARREGLLRRELQNVKVATANIDTFYGAVEVDLTCRFCLKVIQDAVTFWPCGHTFCRECTIAMRTKGGHYQCNECRLVCSETLNNVTLEAIASQWEAKEFGSKDLSISLRSIQAEMEGIERELNQSWQAAYTHADPPQSPTAPPSVSPRKTSALDWRVAPPAEGGARRASEARNSMRSLRGFSMR